MNNRITLHPLLNSLRYGCAIASPLFFERHSLALLIFSSTVLVAFYFSSTRHFLLASPQIPKSSARSFQEKTILPTRGQGPSKQSLRSFKSVLEFSQRIRFITGTFFFQFSIVQGVPSRLYPLVFHPQAHCIEAPARFLSGKGKTNISHRLRGPFSF